MTCAKCGREIAAARAWVAIALGDGHATIDWACFEPLLRPGRVAELMRLLREATRRARGGGDGALNARGEKYQDDAE